MLLAPASEWRNDQFTDIVGDLLVISRGLDHLGSDSFVCLWVSRTVNIHLSGGPHASSTNLSNTCTVVLAESCGCHPVHARGNVSHAETVLFLCICTHR